MSEKNKSTSKSPGNKGKQTNSLKLKAPDKHDDPQRRQPPTPQDIARVQPVSQTNKKNHPGKSNDAMSQKGPIKSKN
jgi:hypothetical protein